MENIKNNQEIDPETKRILNYFKWKLEPEELKEWWEIQKQAKIEARKRLANLATKEKKDWGEVKIFARNDKR